MALEPRRAGGAQATSAGGAQATSALDDIQQSRWTGAGFLKAGDTVQSALSRGASDAHAASAQRRRRQQHGLAPVVVRSPLKKTYGKVLVELEQFELPNKPDQIISKLEQTLAISKMKTGGIRADEYGRVASVIEKLWRVGRPLTLTLP